MGNPQIAAAAGGPSACSQRFHQWLPKLILFGTLLAAIGIGMFMSIEAGEEATKEVLHGAAIGFGVAGTSLFGLSAITRSFLNPKSEYDSYDRLSLWLWISFLFILGATLCAAFNVDEAAWGLGITGGFFALAVTYNMAEGVNAWYHRGAVDPKDKDFYVVAKYGFSSWFNFGGILYDEDTSKLTGGKRSSGSQKTARAKRYAELDQGGSAQRGLGTSKREERDNEHARRLASTVISGSSITSTLIVTLASLLVWYMFFRGQSSQDKPRRRTTIIKKRPTFVKGKRRASHRPTLSTLRSEGNLLAN